MTHDRRSQARRRLRHSDSYREAVGSVLINKARVRAKQRKRAHNGND